MNADQAQSKSLNPPPIPSVRYRRNFIRTAVCELRFPTLLELETTPPRAFQAKIRKEYPFYEPQIQDAVGGSDGLEREHHYLFRSKEKKWTVVVKSYAIALETTNYSHFEDFAARFQDLLTRSQGMIDSDFFTRVGLRYVNYVPTTNRDPKGWIRSDLISGLMGDVLGTPRKCLSVVHGHLANGGGFTFRHGLRGIEESKDSTENGYLLDFDYFKEGVEFGDVMQLVTTFHETNFSFFRWCLDEKALTELGEGELK